MACSSVGYLNGYRTGSEGNLVNVKLKGEENSPELTVHAVHLYFLYGFDIIIYTFTDIWSIIDIKKILISDFFRS